MSPGEQIVLNLVRRQTESGSWGAIEYPLWTDVLTALSVQALRAAGFDDDATWTVRDGDRQYPGGIKRALAYLVNSQSDRGWGEDIHDTCQVLITLLESRSNQRDYANAVSRGVAFVVQQLETDFDDFRSGNWFGPGFYAASLDALSRTGSNRHEVTRILGKLLEMQHADGYFGDPAMAVEFKVWHTSLAVMALTSRGVSLPTSSKTIQRGLLWLEQSQNPNGAWGTGVDRFTAIFAAYGTNALQALCGLQHPAARRGLQWILEHQRADGGVEAIEGTVMGAFVLPRMDARPASQLMPVTEFIEIDKVLVDLEQIVLNLTDALERQEESVSAMKQSLRQEIDNYLIKVTHRQAGQIGLIVGLFGLVLAVVALFPGFR
jgi:hypothetical protein